MKERIVVPVILRTRTLNDKGQWFFLKRMSKIHNNTFPMNWVYTSQKTLLV